MNSAVAIARNDFANALRSRTLWGATVLMTALVALSWLSLGAEFVEQIDAPLLAAVESFSFWVPLVAIVLGYKAVIGERESGRLRVLLGLPCVRRDVVVGKYLSRSVVLLTALAVALAVLSGLVYLRTASIEFVTLLSAAILLVLYALAWTGMALGASSAVSSETRAVALVVGLFALFGPLWEQLAVPVFERVATGNTGAIGATETLTYADGPTWFLYATRISPFQAFEGGRYYLRDLLEIVLTGGNTTAAHAPNLFGVAVLFVWATVPVVVGYRLFDRVDLD